MLERAKTYCPELIWSDERIAGIANELGKKVTVRVSDERSEWKCKVLPRGERPIASKGNDGEPRFLGEKLHPIFDYLDGKEFWVRSDWRTYAPSHVPRDMERFSRSNEEKATGRSDGLVAGLFQSGCERALANTKRR